MTTLMLTLMMTVLILSVAVSGGGALILASRHYLALPDRRPEQLLPGAWLLGAVSVIMFVLTVAFAIGLRITGA